MKFLKIIESSILEEIYIPNIDLYLCIEILKINNIIITINKYNFFDCNRLLLSVVNNDNETIEYYICEKEKHILVYVTEIYNSLIKRRNLAIKNSIKKLENIYGCNKETLHSNNVELHLLEDQKYYVNDFINNINKIVLNSKITSNKKESLYLSLLNIIENESKDLIKKL